VRAEQPARHGGFATIVSLPPPWQPTAAPRPLGKLRTRPGRNIIQDRRELSLRLYHELEKGRMLRLSHPDPAEAHGEISVTVSAIRFREMQPHFLHCLQTRRARQNAADPWDLRAAGIPDDTLDQEVFFATASDHLSPAARTTLAEYARRLSRIPEDFLVSVAGCADPRGPPEYNEALSRRRALRVKAHLVGLGVPENRIVLSFFGATGAQAPQGDGQNLAHERRVSLSLVRKQDAPPRRTVALRGDR